MLAINSLHPVQRRSITFTYMMNFLFDKFVVVVFLCVCGVFFLHSLIINVARVFIVGCCVSSIFLYWFSIDLNVSNCYAMETFDSFQFSLAFIYERNTYTTICAVWERRIRSFHLFELFFSSSLNSAILNLQVEQRSIHYFFRLIKKKCLGFLLPLWQKSQGKLFLFFSLCVYLCAHNKWTYEFLLCVYYFIHFWETCNSLL